uniref:Uncharacterized protein n=1 Tax=Dunaliella tertiolecta TaxID=3047 RepID=A0A7S3R6B5_DUNTE
MRRAGTVQADSWCSVHMCSMLPAGNARKLSIGPFAFTLHMCARPRLHIHMGEVPPWCLIPLCFTLPHPSVGNAGAILVLGRDLVMVPKLIHPLPPSTPRTPDSSGAIDEDLPGGTNHLGGADTWMQQINEERPPTPPRGRPHLPGSSLEYF